MIGVSCVKRWNEGKKWFSLENGNFFTILRSNWLEFITKWNIRKMLQQSSRYGGWIKIYWMKVFSSLNQLLLNKFAKNWETRENIFYEYHSAWNKIPWYLISFEYVLSIHWIKPLTSNCHLAIFLLLLYSRCLK